MFSTNSIVSGSSAGMEWRGVGKTERRQAEKRLLNSKIKEIPISMSQIIIHIGTPRTGTTVLQKHVLQISQKYTIIQKQPYSRSPIFINNNGESTFSFNQAKALIDGITTLESAIEKDKLNRIMNTLSQGAANKDRRMRIGCKELLTASIFKAIQASKSKILVSNERLCDTSSSLNGYSVRKQELCFSIYPLLNACIKINAMPCVCVCLRDPIPYLRSKFIRTVEQRRSFNAPLINPNEYIKNQATLENNHPGTSVLAHAMHSEFIKQLQQHAFVKAYGFQELLASDDVFSLMGLQGEDKYAFRDFPRENKLPATKEQEKNVEDEITQSLKQYGFYDRILKAQMFE